VNNREVPHIRHTLAVRDTILKFQTYRPPPPPSDSGTTGTEVAGGGGPVPPHHTVGKRGGYLVSLQLCLRDVPVTSYKGPHTYEIARVRHNRSATCPVATGELSYACNDIRQKDVTVSPSLES